MRKLQHFLLCAAAAGAMAAALSGCSSGSSDGKTHLTFQIWDVAQRDGMQAICDAYTEKNPNVEIEVQVTSWNEYWTKLEAAAISNQMPDIFWMHTNEILKYADYGKIADLTDLYDEEDPEYFQKHFSEVSLKNIQGSDGRYYGVPKDKDTVGLVYNKEMSTPRAWHTRMRHGPGTICARRRRRSMTRRENTDIWHTETISWGIGILSTRTADTYWRRTISPAALTIRRP